VRLLCISISVKKKSADRAFVTNYKHMSTNWRKSELRPSNTQNKVKPSTNICRRQSVERSELCLARLLLTSIEMWWIFNQSQWVFITKKNVASLEPILIFRVRLIPQQQIILQLSLRPHNFNTILQVCACSHITYCFRSVCCASSGVKDK